MQQGGASKKEDTPSDRFFRRQGKRANQWVQGFHRVENKK
jgi:hypothetical protein